MSRVARQTHPQARRLRREASDAERAFWLAVRNRQQGGLKFRRQVSIGSYIADFACVEAMLIIELDGSQHADAVEYDARRTRYWKIRVTECCGSRIAMCSPISRGS